MHAHSPEDSIDYRAFLSKTQEWDNQIHELLGMHTISLLGSETFHLVQMNVDGAPTWTYWVKAEPAEAPCPDCGRPLYRTTHGLVCSGCLQDNQS